MAPKTKGNALPALDPSRMVEADPRDPRALRTQWPCYGDHPEVAIGNNKFGQWKSCAVCSYRLSYTPREGAPGSDSKTEKLPNGQASSVQAVRGHWGCKAGCGDGSCGHRDGVCQLFDHHKPRRIWVTPRSDRWQPWSHLNHLTWQDRQTLESRQRHERTMLKRMVDFLAWALNRNSLL